MPIDHVTPSFITPWIMPGCGKSVKQFRNISKQQGIKNSASSTCHCAVVVNLLTITSHATDIDINVIFHYYHNFISEQCSVVGIYSLHL